VINTDARNITEQKKSIFTNAIKALKKKAVFLIVLQELDLDG
jgi:hypothetical protein